MSRNERCEITCSCCGKRRMLSRAEAEQDGWLFSTKYCGIICGDCVPRYGIPTTFLNAPVIAIPDGNGGARIEYGNSKRQWDEEKEGY